MQTHGGAAADAAILGAERVFRAKVRVDWNNNGQFDHALSNLDRYIEDVTLDKALSGSAPDEILLIEGSSAAQLNLNIHGDLNGLSLMAVFSPFNTRSIFSGIQTINCEIKYSLLLDTPVGTVEYPQFVGNIRTITPNRADNSVEIVAIDRADKMRKGIQLPPYAMSEEHVAYGEIDSQLIRSQWVIDNALRLCDCSVTDKRPTDRLELGLANDALDGVLVWVTGNGSYLPTIGYLDNLNVDSFPNPGNPMFKQQGPLHSDLPGTTPRSLVLAGLGTPISQGYYAPNHQGLIRYWVSDQDRLNAQAVHYFGGTIALADNVMSPASISRFQLFEINIGSSTYLQVFMDTGRVRMEKVQLNAAGNAEVSRQVTSYVNIPTTGTHVDLFLMWDLTPGVSRVYMRAGSNVLSTSWTNVGSAIPSGIAESQTNDQIKGRFSIGQGVNISDVFYGTSNQTGKPVNDTVQMYKKPRYAAVLDPGLNRFSFVPSAQKQEAWQLVQDVAAAEFGSVFWDETGVFRFWNWQTMLDKRNTVVRTLSLDQVENLVLSNNSDSIRNVYAVTTKKRRSVGITNIFSSSDPMEFYVPPRTISRFVIFIDDTVSPLTFFMPRQSTLTAPPTWNESVVHGMVFQGFDGTQWGEDANHTAPTVTAYYASNGLITLRVSNPNDFAIRFASGGWGASSMPATLRIGGTKILESSDLALEFVNEDSVNKYGPRVLELSGDWYQDGLWTTQLLETVAPRTAEPIPTTDAITIAGDPRLQLGDVIEVTDDAGFGDIKLQIFGIRRSFGRDTGLTDTLSVEVAPPPGPPPTTEPEQPPTQKVTRYNLCNNPTLARNQDDWWSVTRATGISGMSRSTGARFVPGGNDGAIGPKAPVQRGKTYRFSAEVRGDGGSATGTIQIDWYSNAGYLGTAGASSFSVGGTTGTRVYTNAATAPLGATRALIVIKNTSRAIYLGSVLYEETTQALSYFDGDTSGARWDGAAGNSTSRITQEIPL